LNIQVSHGSAATYLRYGEKYDKGFISNVLLSQERKNFKTRKNVKLINKYQATSFFHHTTLYTQT